MFWIGLAASALLIFIVVTIYSSLAMAKRADEHLERNFPDIDLMMESGEEFIEIEKVLEIGPEVDEGMEDSNFF